MWGRKSLQALVWDSASTHKCAAPALGNLHLRVNADSLQQECAGSCADFAGHFYCSTASCSYLVQLHLIRCPPPRRWAAGALLCWHDHNVVPPGRKESVSTGQ